MLGLRYNKEKLVNIFENQRPKSIRKQNVNGLLGNVHKGMHCSECLVFVITFDGKSTPFVRFLNDLYGAIEDLKVATRNAADICPCKNRLAVHI